MKVLRVVQAQDPRRSQCLSPRKRMRSPTQSHSGKAPAATDSRGGPAQEQLDEELSLAQTQYRHKHLLWKRAMVGQLLSSEGDCDHMTAENLESALGVRLHLGLLILHFVPIWWHASACPVTNLDRSVALVVGAGVTLFAFACFGSKSGLCLRGGVTLPQIL